MLGPDYNGDQASDRIQGRRSAEEVSYHTERELGNASPYRPRQNGGYGDLSRPPGSPALSASDRDRDLDPRRSEERNRSRGRNGRTASGQVRVCKKCGEPLTGQFVRALDGTFHLDCFKCRVSGSYRKSIIEAKLADHIVHIGLRSDSCIQILPCRRR